MPSLKQTTIQDRRAFVQEAQKTPYPEPPYYLDAAEADWFRHWVRSRPPNRWNLPTEIDLLADACRLQVRKLVYDDEINERGEIYTDDNGVERIRPVVNIRKSTAMQLRQILSSLRLTAGMRAQANTADDKEQDAYNNAQILEDEKPHMRLLT